MKLIVVVTLILALAIATRVNDEYPKEKLKKGGCFITSTFIGTLGSSSCAGISIMYFTYSIDFTTIHLPNNNIIRGGSCSRV